MLAFTAQNTTTESMVYAVGFLCHSRIDSAIVFVYRSHSSVYSQFMTCCVCSLKTKPFTRCGLCVDLFHMVRLAFSLSIDFNALASQPVSLTVSPHQPNNNTMRALRLSLLAFYSLSHWTDVRSLILCLARFLSKSHTLYMQLYSCGFLFAWQM